MKKRLTIFGIAVVIAASSFSIGVAAKYVGLPWTKNIYFISDPEERENGMSQSTISVLDDRGNRCYVIANRGTSEKSISCVRMDK